jgi:hypothetical protein
MIARARASEASFARLALEMPRPSNPRMARRWMPRRRRPQAIVPRWQAWLLSAWLVLTASAAVAILLLA